MTSDFEQASKHAIKKASVYGDEPVVFIYSIDREKLRQKFISKIFLRMDEVWAQFIYENRSPNYSKLHPYDYVYGGVADGQNLFDLLAEMDNDKLTTGEIDYKYFLEAIANFIYDQLSIHNQDIISQQIVKLERVVKANDKKSEYVPA